MEQIQLVITGFHMRDPFGQKFQFEFPKIPGAEWDGYSSELLELLVYLKEFLSYYDKIETLFRGRKNFFSKIDAQGHPTIILGECWSGRS